MKYDLLSPQLSFSNSNKGWPSVWSFVLIYLGLLQKKGRFHEKGWKQQQFRDYMYGHEKS